MRVIISIFVVLILSAGGVEVVKAAGLPSSSAANVDQGSHRLATLFNINHKNKNSVRDTSSYRDALFASISRHKSRHTGLAGALLRSKRKIPPSISRLTARDLPKENSFPSTNKHRVSSSSLWWHSERMSISRKLHSLNSLSNHVPERNMALRDALSRKFANRDPALLATKVSRNPDRNPSALGSSHFDAPLVQARSPLSSGSRAILLRHSSRSSLPTSAREGLTLDPCSSDAECVSPRTCILLDDDNPIVPCSPDDLACLCIAPSLTFCTTTTDCPQGEVCATIEGTSSTFCASGEVVELIPEIEEVDNVAFPSPGPPEVPDPSVNETAPSSGGLTGDTCESDAQCVPDRSCITFSVDSANGSPCSFGDDNCLCIPPEFLPCTSSVECVPGEVCALVDPDLDGICLSEELVEVSGIPEVGPVNSTESTPSPSPPATPSGGLTADDCQVDSDCVPDRTCQGAETDSCPVGGFCFCFPPELQFCSSSVECVPGEVCVALEGIEDTFCVSEEFADSASGVGEVSPGNSTVPDDPLVEPSAAPPAGLTGDQCVDDFDCLEDRSCDISGDCSAGNCICLPLVLTNCTSSVDCVEGEVCVTIVDTDLVVCVSEQAEQNFDEISEVDPEDTGPSDAGFTGDQCTSNVECSGDRSCLVRDGGLPCSDGDSCICVPARIIVCESNSDCVVGEVCATTSTSVSTQGICVSEEVVDDVAELDELVRANFVTSRIEPDRSSVAL